MACISSRSRFTEGDRPWRKLNQLEALNVHPTQEFSNTPQQKLTHRPNFYTLRYKMATLRKVPSTHVARLFTSGEVQEIVGLTQRKLGHLEQPWRIPTVAKPVAAEVGGFMLCWTWRISSSLSAYVNPVRPSRKMRRALLNLSHFADEPAPIGELEVIKEGNRVLNRRSNEQLMDPISWQYAHFLPVAGLLDEIEQQVSSVQAWGGGNGGGVDAKVALQ